MVYRIFVEKRPGLSPEATNLLSDLKNFLDIENLEGVRLLNRYDVENIDPAVYEAAKGTVFSEPQVDVTYDETFPEPRNLHSLLAVVLMGLMLLGALTLSPAYWLGVALLSLVLICLGPAVSRFDLKFWELWSLSFLLAVRGIPWVLLTALGAAAVALAQFFLLPMAVVLIGPGAMCLAATFPMEKVLAKAMPPKEDNEDEWYYG